MPEPKLFPALRCRMGDWLYYVTFMTFQDVCDWIKSTTEVHKSKQLSEFIQRELDDKRANSIAKYLIQQKERMFNALFVGIYGGKPKWGEVQVSSSLNEPFKISKTQSKELTRSIGLLSFNGEEKLFAIDGQHRVAGIKDAIKKDKKLKIEEVAVILVGHQTNSEGQKRTRRLFTTLNKTAKKVSISDIIALDEDNGAAIITRKMIDDFQLFREGKFVSFNPDGSIRPTDINPVTNIVTIYNIIKSDLISCISKQIRQNFSNRCPSEEEISEIYNFHCQYWNLLVKSIPEYNDVFIKKTYNANDFRKNNNNHLMFRPIGQRVFAISVAHLVTQYDWSIQKSVQELAKVSLWLHDETWHDILWNPIENKMLKGITLAKIHLLSLINQTNKIQKQVSKKFKEYEEIIKKKK